MPHEIEGKRGNQEGLKGLNNKPRGMLKVHMMEIIIINKNNNNNKVTYRRVWEFQQQGKALVYI